MKIQETTKNGPRPNIDTPPVIRVKTEHKRNIVINSFSPSGGSNVIDKSSEKNYNEYKEEIDRLAKDWIELLLNGILENRNNSFPALDKKWH